jgi:L-lactate dehydrogenase (cytochrome)
MSRVNDCHSIADLKAAARARMPSVLFDYIQGGAEDELTAAWNRDAFSSYAFLPRTLRDVSKVNLSTTVQGIKIDLPIIAAPTGMTRMFHHEGELAVAKASHKAGTAYTLSSVATTSIEDVAMAAKGTLFFQVYVWHNRKMIQDFIERCRKLNYTGIMLAVDLAALGKRERDLHHGHGHAAKLKWNIARSAITKPAWLYHYLSQPKWRMANMLQHLPQGALADKVLDKVNEQFDASVTWEDARELMKAWGGKFILKGIQCKEDAVLAAEMGATGIVISNHGGRQLDGAAATLDLLPEIVEAVGKDIEVMIDGGITRGSDVIKALALGAKACLIGRAYLYGLGAGGEKGVTRCYDILREEMVRVMQLIGCSDISELGPQYLRKRIP